MFSDQIAFVIYYILSLHRCGCFACPPGGSFPSCFSCWGCRSWQDGSVQGKAVCKARRCAKGWQHARHLLWPICASEIAGVCAKHSLGAALLAGTRQEPRCVLAALCLQDVRCLDAVLQNTPGRAAGGLNPACFCVCNTPILVS